MMRVFTRVLRELDEAFLEEQRNINDRQQKQAERGERRQSKSKSKPRGR